MAAAGPASRPPCLTRHLGVLYQRAAEGESALGYLGDYSATLLLIDPKGRFAAVFSTPRDAPGLAADIGALLESH